MADDTTRDTGKNQNAPTNAPQTRHKRIGPYPFSEDDLLRKVIEAGPSPEKRDKPKKRPHGGATTTPKPKPQKGK